MTNSTDTTQSAGVVLTRDRGGELEVFWARRPASKPFMGGFFSYFVGKVEPGDVGAPIEAPGESAGGSPNWPCGLDRSFCAAALRELREESGLELDARELVHLGGWRTPSWLDADYYTEFFWRHLSQEEGDRLDVDRLAERVDPDEIDLAEWIRPADALERWRTGRARMTTPLVAILEIFANTPADERRSALDARRKQTDRDAPIEVVGGVRVLPLETATLPPATHTNCYLVGGADFVVVDPGSGDRGQLDLLEAAVDRLVGAGKRLEAVVLTHHHPDHVGGLAALVERYDVPVWAHHETALRLDGVDVVRELADGERLELGEQTLVCLHTPGHAPGHLCLHHDSTDSVLVGDLVASKGTIVIDPPDGHVGSYLASLERVRDLEARTLFPAHGWAIVEPNELLSYYIAHRNEREQAVLDALRGAGRPATPLDLVPEVYDDVPKHVWPLAARSLLAHLVHLDERGLADTDGERFWAV